MLHLVWYNQCGFASHCSVEALSEVGLIVSMKFRWHCSKDFHCTPDSCLGYAASEVVLKGRQLNGFIFQEPYLSRLFQSQLVGPRSYPGQFQLQFHL